MTAEAPEFLLDRIELQRAIHISFESMSRGIDNYRYDVRLSSRFTADVRKIVRTLVSVYAKPTPGSWDGAEVFDKFRDKYRDLMTVLIHRLKTDLDADHIALLQFAPIKYLVHSIRAQLDEEVRAISSRLAELRSQGSTEALATQARLFWLKKNYERILYQISKLLFRELQKAEERQLAPVRRQYLGTDYQFITNAITTPLHLTSELSSLPLLINEFCMWSSVSEDADFIAMNNKLETLVCEYFPDLPFIPLHSDGGRESTASEIHDDLGGLFRTQPFLGVAGDTKATISESFCWLDIPENIHSIFSPKKNQQYIEDQKHANGMKAGWKAGKDVKHLDKFLKAFAKQLRTEKMLEQLITSQFVRRSVSSSILERVDLKTVCQYLCGQIAINKVEDSAATGNKLNKEQLKSLEALQSDITEHLEAIDDSDLIKLLTEISRYRQQLKYFRFAHRAFNRLNLLTSKDDIKLSESAGTLYKLPTSKEIEDDSDRICHHTIMKADVRGSTTVTDDLQAKGLNPASYFSTRFFNPINKILETYGANKVFIEGDAIILSFLEHETSPQQWFSASRACGYARDMIKIVASNNRYSTQMGLPLLELGVGICYSNEGPRFLYDGDRPIMISGAIGLADRMSGCSWNLRSVMEKGLFNVNVLRYADGEKGKGEKGQEYLRYNVNGINVDHAAYAKLQQEMSLRSLKMKLNGVEYLFHYGQYPDTKGRKKDLVIREGKIGLWQGSQVIEDPDAQESYYEIVVNRKVLSLILEKVGQTAKTAATQT